MSINRMTPTTPEEPELDPETIVAGIICNECGNTLPPHTVRDHLTEEHPIHECPHSIPNWRN